MFFQTTAADVFSLGCLYYYVWTWGHHPFGDSLRRQVNILTGQSDLSLITGVLMIFLFYSSANLFSIVSADDSLQLDLISQMIRSAEQERPSLAAVLKHPVFWDANKRLSFYLVCII